MGGRLVSELTMHPPVGESVGGRVGTDDNTGHCLLETITILHRERKR